jgi:RNA polymerase sigma-32 factor
VAKDLGVTAKDVLEMESRMSGRDIGFDEPDDDEERSQTFSPVTYLQDQGQEPSRVAEADELEEQNHQLLTTALGELDERSRDIIGQRWLTDDKSTLHELADKYGVSAERIRQLESNAIRKLKVAMAA